MRIVVLHDAVGADARPDELDVFVQVEVVSQALRRLGHEPQAMPFDMNLRNARATLADARPDLVFNLVEAVDGQGRMIYLAPALIEAMQIPIAGSGSVPMFVTSSKILAKQMLMARGLPTPRWYSADSLKRGNDFVPGRYIVKSLWEEASVGLDDDSIVTARIANDLLAVMDRKLAQLGGEAFAEEYIDGREFNLSVLVDERGEPEVLPPAEIDFVDYAPGKPKFVGYKAKWDEGSFEFHHTPRRFDFPDSDRVLLNLLTDLAQTCWKWLDLRGWVRVDFRVDEAGQPFILEVNANPCLSPDAGFAAATQRAGLSFEKVIDRIIRDAVRSSENGGSREVLFVAGQGNTDARKTSGSDAKGATSKGVAAKDGIRFRDHIVERDLKAVRDIVASTGFFHDFEIDVAVELVEDRLKRGDASDYHFVFAELEGRVVGYTCYGPIACTQGSYDLYWIAVHDDCRSRGLGRRLMQETESRIAGCGGRRVYIETSSRELYSPTRAFYVRCGYSMEAIMRGFYADGDDKVVYVRDVSGAQKTR